MAAQPWRTSARLRLGSSHTARRSETPPGGPFQQQPHADPAVRGRGDDVRQLRVFQYVEAEVDAARGGRKRSRQRCVESLRRHCDRDRGIGVAVRGAGQARVIPALPTWAAHAASPGHVAQIAGPVGCGVRVERLAGEGMQLAVIDLALNADGAARVELRGNASPAFDAGRGVAVEQGVDEPALRVAQDDLAAAIVEGQAAFKREGCRVASFRPGAGRWLAEAGQKSGVLGGAPQALARLQR